MPAKKKAPTKEPTKETVSEKSEGAAVVAGKAIETSIAKRLTDIEERLESLVTTVDAIRSDYKSKGIPMP